MTVDDARAEQLILEPIQIGRELFDGSFATAARRLHREAELHEQFTRERAAAARRLTISASLRELYRMQIDISVDSIRTSAPRLQWYENAPVALIDQRWLTSQTLPALASRMIPLILGRLRLPHEHALLVLRPSSDRLSGYMAKVSDGWEISCPDDTAAATLVTMLHEIGHFLYETGPAALPGGTVGQYIESEAFALALGWYGFETHLRMTQASEADLLRWNEYRRTESWLNNYFFLQEASELGLCSPPCPRISKLYLKRTYSGSAGYQIIYAAADSVARDASHLVPAGKVLEEMLG